MPFQVLWASMLPSFAKEPNIAEIVEKREKTPTDSRKLELDTKLHATTRKFSTPEARV